MKKAIISDVDGTISDRRHRLHHLEQKKDWESFFLALINDPPIQKTLNQIENLLPKYDALIFVTGRPEKYRSLTNKWIKTNTNFINYNLLMRENKDYRQDVIIKKEMLCKIKKEYETDIVFEDQDEIAAMWTQEGLNCVLTR